MLQYFNFYVTVDGSPDQYYVEARGLEEIQVSRVLFEYRESDTLRQQLEKIYSDFGRKDEAMKLVGSLLYNALFARSIQRAWARSRAELPKGGKLRLRLNIRPRELSRLPWELLYDADEGYFLAARLSYSIVRYIESGIPVASALARHPLRVLYLQASPLNMAPLDLKASEKALRQALGANCEIKVMRNPTPDKLLTVLREKPGFHILHYDGHALFDQHTTQGYLALHDAKNRASMLSGEKLATFLADTTVRLVVLAACQTGMDAPNKRFAGIAQHLMHTSNLPAAVAMQLPIPDKLATHFIDHFYQALAAGYPIDTAVVEGRKGILASLGHVSSPEWATPVLFMRAKDGYILPPKEAKPSPLLLTAPKPPKQFVQRPDEFNQLINLLLASGTQRTVAITTALQGGGGFGKTTLAQAICHDERVKEAFPDGILWVTIGQTPSLVELLSVQIKYFAPNENYADINAAQARLRALLEGKRVLFVLDDVWQESHARPFVQDNAACAHLITTRQQKMARWLQAQAVNVNQMQTSEAVDLLVKWLAGTKAVEKLATDEVHQLAEYLGEWPLLLELIAAQLRDIVQRRRKSLFQAIQDVRKRLERRGFTAFDRTREKERNRAISISLGVSLDELDLLCEEALGDKDIWRQRYLELAIFPEDVDMPLTTIFKLWEETAFFDELDSEDALHTMQSLSLFTRYDTDKQTIRLHDVIRAYLAQQQAKKLPDLHSQFLAAYDMTNWADLPADEPYLWQHLAYHLYEAKHHDELRVLLLDFDWMDAKLHATEINTLLSDYRWLPEDNTVQKVERALRLASHVLAQDKKQLASQLWGRLPEDKRAPLISITPPSTWLRPLYPSLLSHPALVRTLAGHTGIVNAVAVTADGRWALSASIDYTVKVWDLATGQEHLCLAGHTDMVWGVAVTVDGRWALSASDDKTVKVWDLTTGQERLCFAGHTKAVRGVAVTADGRWALSASWDKTVKVWDLATGQERLCFAGHTQEVDAVAVTRDGRWVLSASRDYTVKVWDLATGQERLCFAGHIWSVNAVAVTADGRWALSASSDGVKMWDLTTGQEHLSLADCHMVTGVAVSADGRWALSAFLDHKVKVWDLATGQERLSLAAHTDWVNGVAMTTDGRWGLSASKDKTLKVWDLAASQKDFSLAGHTSRVNGVAVSADGRWALSASYREVKVWDLATGEERLSFASHTDEV